MSYEEKGVSLIYTMGISVTYNRINKYIHDTQTRINKNKKIITFVKYMYKCFVTQDYLSV